MTVQKAARGYALKLFPTTRSRIQDREGHLSGFLMALAAVNELMQIFV